MVQEAVRTASPIDVTTPWWAFGTESPRGCRRSPRAGAVPRPLPGRAHRRQVEPLDDPVADGADALDGHLHHVTGPQRRGSGLAAGAPQLGQAAAVAAGARAEHVAGADLGDAGGVGDELLERPAHVGQQVLADLDVIDAHPEVEGEETVVVAV